MRLLLLVFTLLATGAIAADLVQLSEQNTLTLTLYPGQTRALVRETRQLALPAGESSLWFAWTGARIEAASLALSLPEATVGEVIRPAGQDTAFRWRVTSPAETTTTATFSYFLEGCRWQTAYRLWVPSGGGPARLEGDLLLTNETGLDLDNIALQIAVTGTGPEAPPQLHQLTGSYSIPQGETRSWPLISAEPIASSVEFRYGVEQYGGAVERILQLNLDPATQRPLALLPSGLLTVYDLAEDSIPLIKGTLGFGGGYALELDLGPEPDIVVERKLMNTVRTNLEQDRVGKISGCDTHEDYVINLRNRLALPVDLRITEVLTSTWELRADLAPVSQWATGAQFMLSVPSEGQAKLKFTLVKHSGTRVP